MPDINNNQESIMDDSMSASQVPGQGYALRSGAVALRIPQGAIGLPMVQYPIDDTMPVKAWVFEVQPSDQRPYKPLRPEDERKALEAINRHLPPSERIEITQPSRTVTGMEVALNPRPRPYPGTSHTGPEDAAQSTPRRYHGTHLPLPPRSRDQQDRNEAAKSHGSSKNITPAQATGKETEPMNWAETQNQ
ncbi:hypothetical protein INS49_007760 [Diaporthe citri]|uniref:uncharacterized protein n=1 Tax=Diaporthe citri TaxID=83186 RepID=UPI001C814BB6|nr:uncharacterized protein INS49_007760 [Diaporthe citri]KAG6362668.1 hypothetical protein INS49_007760 [Diaporthe citri]